MTKKLEIIFCIGVVLGACGIIAMWAFGFNGKDDAAANSLIFAGVASFVAIIAKGLAALRRYNGAID